MLQSARFGVPPTAAGGFFSQRCTATLGGTPEELLLEGDFTPLSWSPDGRLLISVPLDLDIDHSITLETGWALQLNE